jgi:hypothetical protein
LEWRYDRDFLSFAIHDIQIGIDELTHHQSELKKYLKGPRKVISFNKNAEKNSKDKFV